ncbi:hypothetical protein SEA_CLUBPENGUIN_74 [Streptomyces phage ClubPenguin]|nr:hypothetical protein SEA_CLUBPENGUIN_74 [Streptomyces phage ClubPenguin]
MNVLEFVLLVSAGIVALAVGIDVGQQIWVEKQAARKAQLARLKAAEATLMEAISKRLEERMKDRTNVIELKVVASPKMPVGGRHRRLTAA